MIRINELLDNPVKYWATSGSSFKFVTPKGTPIMVALRDIEENMGPEDVREIHREIMWYLKYSPKDRQESKNFLFEMAPDFGGELMFYVADSEVDRSGDKFALTHTGEQFIVFSTIFEILKNELHDVGYFVFTGDEVHEKFYDTLEKLLPKKLTQFEFVGNYIHVNGKGYIYVNPDVYAEVVDNSY